MALFRQGVRSLRNTATVQHLDHAPNSCGSGSSFAISDIESLKTIPAGRPPRVSKGLKIGEIAPVGCVGHPPAGQHSYRVASSSVGPESPAAMLIVLAANCHSRAMVMPRRPGPGKSIGEGPVFCRPARSCCRSRFTSPQQLVSYAGLNPRVRQSGLEVAQHGAPGLSPGGFA